MLAKLWKKVLLAVCIIACIFNIMSKLVNRHSLKENLESANDGITIFSVFQKEEVVESESQPIIDGVMNPEPAADQDETNTSVVSTYQTNETENSAVVVEIDENNTMQETVEENPQEEVVVEENPQEEIVEEESEKNNSFKFSDFTILF